jgi:zinc transport system substrate-binding protein
MLFHRNSLVCYDITYDKVRDPAMPQGQPMLRAFLLTLLVSVTTASADVPDVVADIPPVHSLVAAVMGDLGQPTLLLGRGADAHDYQMRPSDARALARASAIFWIGPEMTPWLARALENGEPGRDIRLLAAPGTHARRLAEGGTDPHAFLDPGNAVVWMTLIADRLSQLDPTNAATYRANADAESGRIAALDARIKARLGTLQSQPIVVFHESLGYFADLYGLNIIGSVAESDAADPGAAGLSRIVAEMARNVCIYPETGHDPKLIETLADGTAARLGPALDPEGRDLEPGPGLYAALLANLGTGIAACLTDR